MFSQSGPARARLLEIIVLVLVVFLLVMILIPVAGGRRSHPQIRDASHIRAVIQAQILWAQNNQGRYPLPSTVDVDNDTVPEIGRAKDTTANIYSLLLYNGLITPELLVSPVEQGNIEVDDDYDFSAPSAAVNPGRALWDPAFRADFTGDKPGNASYAHAIPHPVDEGRWRNTFNETHAAVSNRGPRVEKITYKEDGSLDTVDFDRSSITLRFHGDDTTWSGNVGYNDNHVAFTDDLAPGATYTTDEGADRPDILFFDEPDSIAGNNFLSVFIKAGDQRADFDAIWD